MDFVQALINLLENDFKLKSVTKLLSPTKVIRVTRRHKPSKRNKSNEYVVTIGAPNYLTAKYIKLCKKAGEPFPVRKLRFEAIPVKRKKK